VNFIMELLGMLFGSLSGAAADVAKDVLKTPAKEIDVSSVRGELNLLPVPVGNILNEYDGMLSRS